jgi:hypothetical protein
MHLKHMLTCTLAALLAISLAGCPRNPDLAVSATSHHFGIDPNTSDYETTWNFQAWNSGAAGTSLVFTVESNVPWATISPVTAGESTGADDKVTFTVTIDREYSELDKALAFASGIVTVKSSVRNREIAITTAPDYFTESIASGAELDQTALTFTPNGGPSFYGKTRADITDFPTDPAGGLLLDFDAFGDPIKAGLFGDEEVSFYGKSYETLYIGSGGWLSFGVPGNNSATLGQHFSVPQIAMIPVDATDDDAMVSYLQDDDKLAITFENAPSANDPNGTNDFQIELFFNGIVRLSFLNVDPAVSGIVGFSVGGAAGGVPPTDFIESDLEDANTEPLKVALD